MGPLHTDNSNAKEGTIWNLKGQRHGRYHDFWPKFTKFKL